MTSKQLDNISEGKKNNSVVESITKFFKKHFGGDNDRKFAKKYPDGMVEKNSAVGIIVDILITIFLCVVMFCCIIPLWHTIMCSISDGKVLLGHEGLAVLPVGAATFDGYKLIFANPNILRGYFNTILYVVGSCFCGFVINVIGGYVLSRQTKLKGVLALIVLFTTMFSGGTVPTYMVIRRLGMTGTPLALIIPGCTNAMFVLMVMRSFNSVPESTVEAARIDGAGHFKIMFNVMLPQAMGMTIVTIINTAILSWNSWLPASIYVPTAQNWWPLQLWIKQLVANSTDFLNYANPDYARYLIQYCVIVISTLPIIIVFPFFQKRLEKGMVMGAVKE